MEYKVSCPITSHSELKEGINFILDKVKKEKLEYVSLTINTKDEEE